MSYAIAREDGAPILDERGMPFGPESAPAGVAITSESGRPLLSQSGARISSERDPTPSGVVVTCESGDPLTAEAGWTIVTQVDGPLYVTLATEDGASLLGISDVRLHDPGLPPITDAMTSASPVGPKVPAALRWEMVPRGNELRSIAAESGTLLADEAGTHLFAEGRVASLVESLSGEGLAGLLAESGDALFLEGGEPPSPFSSSSHAHRFILGSRSCAHGASGRFTFPR